MKVYAGSDVWYLRDIPWRRVAAAARPGRGYSVEVAAAEKAFSEKRDFGAALVQKRVERRDRFLGKVRPAAVAQSRLGLVHEQEQALGRPPRPVENRVDLRRRGRAERTWEGGVAAALRRRHR